ncbi:MAG: hypothetical protein K6F33_03855 [Bacteroidales bacterium]|nr:hypothetical protein [Bacteroidales bacterium]
MKIAKLIIAAMLASLAYTASAQITKYDDDDVHIASDELFESDDENGFHFSTEFVTEDVWRGCFDASAAFEPEISYTIGGLSIGTWAASPLNYGSDDYRELDWYVEYAFDFGLSFMMTDYCWTDDNGQFEYFGKYKDTHFLEATLGYDLGAVTDVPLSFNVNTMIAGANRKENGDQALSTYMELIYAPSLKHVDLSLTLGAAAEPEAILYSRKDGFNIVNIDLGVSHDFNIKDVATLTVMAHVICNPTGIEYKGEAYALGGVAISF